MKVEITTWSKSRERNISSIPFWPLFSSPHRALQKKYFTYSKKSFQTLWILYESYPKLEKKQLVCEVYQCFLFIKNKLTNASESYCMSFNFETSTPINLHNFQTNMHCKEKNERWLGGFQKPNHILEKRWIIFLLIFSSVIFHT